MYNIVLWLRLSCSSGGVSKSDMDRGERGTVSAEESLMESHSREFGLASGETSPASWGGETSPASGAGKTNPAPRGVRASPAPLLLKGIMARLECYLWKNNTSLRLGVRGFGSFVPVHLYLQSLARFEDLWQSSVMPLYLYTTSVIINYRAAASFDLN